jgi:glucan phosphorylase
MKAALNGVPSLSILDGWWIEGCIEGFTGWAIEDGASDAEEAASLYKKLETAVVPLYLDAPEKWARLMRTTLAFNGSYFNTNRMVKQYARNSYYPVQKPCREGMAFFALAMNDSDQQSEPKSFSKAAASLAPQLFLGFNLPPKKRRIGGSS